MADTTNDEILLDSSTGRLTANGVLARVLSMDSDSGTLTATGTSAETYEVDTESGVLTGDPSIEEPENDNIVGRAFITIVDLNDGDDAPTLVFSPSATVDIPVTSSGTLIEESIEEYVTVAMYVNGEKVPITSYTLDNDNRSNICYVDEGVDGELSVFVGYTNTDNDKQTMQDSVLGADPHFPITCVGTLEDKEYTAYGTITVRKNVKGETGDKGADGNDGKDAKILHLTGEQFFTYANGFATTDSFSPTSIMLKAEGQNLESSAYSWSFKRPSDNSSWVNLTLGSGNTITVTPSLLKIGDEDSDTMCTVTCSCDGVTDSVTICKLENGGALTVVLSNESHTFAGDTEKAIAASVTCNVLAFRGSTRCSAYIGTITGAVTGMKVTRVNNSTQYAGFTVTVDSTLTTRSGELTIPITVQGVALTKVFTWALSLAGEQGTPGEAAVDFFFSPDTLTFTTDDNGVLTETSKTVAVGYRQGKTTGTATVTGTSNNVNCSSSLANSGAAVTIIPTQDTTELSYQYYDENGEVQTGKRKVCPSAGSCLVACTCTIGTKTYTGVATLRFVVDYKKQISQFLTEADNFTSKIGTVETDQNRNYKELYTQLTQTKGMFSMKVFNQYTEESVSNGKNLIQNSYLRMINKTNTGDSLRTVTLEAGKTYTLSARGMINPSMATEETINRMCVYAYADGWAESICIPFTATSLTTKSVTFTPTVGGTWYVYITPTDSSNSATAEMSLSASRWYVEWMQLEEGDTATDWQACVNDLAANLPLSTTWTKIGTLLAYLPDCTKGNVTYYDNSGGSTSAVVLSNKTFALEANMSYTLSFWAKGNGKMMSIFFKNTDSTDTVNAFYGRVLGSSVSSVETGLSGITLPTDWTFYEITVTCKTAKAAGAVALIFNLYSGGIVYLTDAKIEQYGKATRGLADNLLPTGIDIYNGEIVLTSDNVKVRNNAGEMTAMIDENGNLLAGSLNSVPSDDYGATITIKGGLMTVKGQGKSYMEIGLNEYGFAHIAFYDYLGDFMYDLGPEGISELKSNSWTDKVTLVLISKNATLEDEIVCDASTFPMLFENPGSYTTVTLLRYHAHRKDGVAQADETYGFDAAMAEEADNMLFESMAYGDCVAAEGYYMEQNPTNLDLVHYKNSVYRWRKFFYHIVSQGSYGEQITYRAYCSQEDYRKINGIEEGSD